MKITILGLTITSSWGNGHATTFRSLCRALHALGHQISFIERDVEWYRSNRDLPKPPYVQSLLYEDWQTDGADLVTRESKDADVLVIGSYFPDAIAATALLRDLVHAPILFYDIDTPITLAQLRAHGRTDYLLSSDIPHYAAYMSFTGGPALDELRTRFGSPYPVPLFCSVDPTHHARTAPSPQYTADLSYLGTYAPDRQPGLMRMLDDPARRLPNQSFLVAGPMYPTDIPWSPNVRQLTHVSPPDHSTFYSSSRFTLNLTRSDMTAAGFSPSVRLFEASACSATIISDPWPGLDTFLTPGKEILLASTAEDVTSILTGLSDRERLDIGNRARDRILSTHTAAHRAREFEDIIHHITAA